MRMTQLKMRFATVLLAGLAAFSGVTTSAQSKDELYVAGVAATCAACHGTQGKAVNGSAVVSLAGLSKDDIVAQMAAFKAGTRPATVMHQISKGYSDAQIAIIATYFAVQKK